LGDNKGIQPEEMLVPVVRSSYLPEQVFLCLMVYCLSSSRDSGAISLKMASEIELEISFTFLRLYF